MKKLLQFPVAPVPEEKQVIYIYTNSRKAFDPLVKGVLIGIVIGFGLVTSVLHVLHYL
jgi:hypothetical protein